MGSNFGYRTKSSHLAGLIEAGDWTKLFSEGACFHFALRAAEAGLGELWCLRCESDFEDERENVPHAFVKCGDGRCFDSRGFRAIDAIANDFGVGTDETSRTTKDEIIRKFEAWALTDALNQEIYAIADREIAAILRAQSIQYPAP